MPSTGKITIRRLLEAGLPAAGLDLWHDRPVFHFLTEAADRRARTR